VTERVALSYIQIADGFFSGARSAAEAARNKMFINHSCTANLGIRGQIIFEASGSGVSGHHRRVVHVGEREVDRLTAPTIMADPTDGMCQVRKRKTSTHHAEQGGSV
jgi:hypothetical protein